MDRPTVIVDLDNVVYDFVGAFYDMLWHGRALDTTVWPYREPGQDAPGYTQWSIWDDWGMTKGEFTRWWRLGIESGEIYGRGEVITGARDALWQLSDAEWNIHLVTNRLTKFGLHDTIVDNTSRWLRENNIPYRELSFASDKTRILADAIVDDRWDNMDMQVHGQCFEFGAPHNESLVTWDYVLDRLLVNAETVV